MLLSFETENYKSFKNKLSFSMIPAPKQKGLDYSIMKKTVNGRSYKGLSSATVYGPNASGKTNLIGAMDTMKAIVLRGNVRNVLQQGMPNHAAYSLELIPFRGAEETPTLFSIKFIEKDYVIIYSFRVQIGRFLDADAERKIIEETLYVNEKLVFSRTDSLVVELPNCVSSLLNADILKNTDSALKLAINGLTDDELFLTNGFKSIFAKELVSMITEWFDKRFIVIYRSDSVQVMRRYSDPKNDTIYIENTLTKAAKVFGINSNALGYKTSKDEDDAILCSIFDEKDGKKAISSEVYESYGTIRFINEFPLVINALLNGGTLVMDEFDASIHPMALMNIITIFHNDDINRNHAQLIFNTHNPIFLSPSLFRRDEIKFIERDEDTHESIQYSLSDFKTYGNTGVRKNTDYMRNYFVSQYGAIRNIDFSPIIQSIMDEQEEIGNA